MPRNSLWINFISLAFTNNKVCLTNDYYTINLNDPGKFLIKADNVEEQHCYFNIKTNDRLYNTFISKGIRNSASKIDYTHFQIEHALGKSKTTETYNTTAELKELLEMGQVQLDQRQRSIEITTPIQSPDIRELDESLI